MLAPSESLSSSTSDDRTLLEKLLPPGLRALVTHAHYFVGPPLVVLLSVRLVKLYAGVGTPPAWFTALACVLSYPALLAAYTAWGDFQYQRGAARRGARMPTVVPKNGIEQTGDKEKLYLLDDIFRVTEKFGTSFMFRPFRVFRVFLTIEPEHIKAILATDFASFEKGSIFRDQMKSLLGVGVFNADDELWKFHRSMTRPFFSKDRVSHFDIFDRHASDAIEQMKSRIRQGYAVDWQDLVSRFTLDSATEFLFGKDVHSLSTELPYPPTSDMGRANTARPDADAFASAFMVAQKASYLRAPLQSLWGLREFWRDQVEAQRGDIDTVINPIIADALRQKAEKGQSAAVTDKPSEEDTLLSQLVQVTDDAKLIHDETLNILLAGRDTTACTLTFAVYRLAEHPDVLQRLREEILSVVGPSRRPSYEDIRNMKYLRAVINETLRLYPPVPVNIRTASKDTVLPTVNMGEQGIYIPAGMRCIYSVFNMHRRKDLWGPDALSFDPDRFLDDRLHKYLTPNPFIFLPFNAGPRICLGQQFAYNETSFMLVRLLQHISAIEFTPEVAPESVIPFGYNDSPGSDGTDRVCVRSHLTAFVKGGLWIKVTETAND